jgi:hypothetical protein
LYNVSLEALGKTVIWISNYNEIILNLVQKGFTERDTVKYTRLTQKGLDRGKEDRHDDHSRYSPRNNFVVVGGNIANVYRSIDFDIRHGVTNEEVLVFFDRVRNDMVIKPNVGSYS